MFIILIILALLGVTSLLLIQQASIYIWAILYTFVALLLIQFAHPGMLLSSWLIAGFMVFLIGIIRPLRRNLVSRFLLKIVSNAVPTMSRTEREALEAGGVGWEADLFRGNPDFTLLREAPTVTLTQEEEDFLNGPVNMLCRMIDDWDITHNRLDLSPEVWNFIKNYGFLGMIIPKKYGGLGFSATAQIAVLLKLYSSSVTLASTVSVPNSLGPAELLLKYGTKEQKEYYLPRLARGLEIPCFALTGPNAGSDAASIPDSGVVCKGSWEGKEVLGIRLACDKRYITLAPIATLIGLAFRLFDPHNLLGKGNDIGITCALIPADTPGILAGRRHFPLNLPFMNGPIQGKDVFIPLNFIIGGAEMVGQGWRMLMECLSAGRAISLPSGALGTTQSAALASGAYSHIRKQFQQPIGKFEGIQEPLSQIAGYVYLIKSALSMTSSAIDNGTKSAIAGAILKYHTTELARKSLVYAMDIHGGKGICLGPKNYLGRNYEATPISITVEGANILTRSLIIFGQGVIRCHPYVFNEIESARTRDLTLFDETVWGHASFMMANFMKSLFFSLTGAYGSKAPPGPAKRYYQLVHRYSSNLAYLSDFCMMTIGSELKRKERLSARLGDILSALYLTSGVLQKFHRDGELEEDLPFLHWCCQYLLCECESAMLEVIANFPIPWMRIILRLVLSPFGSRRHKPSDHLSQKLAHVLMTPGAARSRLVGGLFCEPLENCPLGQLEEAFHKVVSVAQLEKKLLQGIKDHSIKALAPLEQIEEAYSLGILNDEEMYKLKDAELARQKIIAVDDFSNEELRFNPQKGDQNKKKFRNQDDLFIEKI